MAPDGRVEVAFRDTRDDPGHRANDVYVATSHDNGDTWSANTRVTDRPIDRRIGVWSTNFDITSPPGLALAKEYTMLAWDDTRNTDTSAPDARSLGGGLQDIYTSAVQYEELGGGASRAAKVGLAGVVGLLIVGLALLGHRWSASATARSPRALRRSGKASKAKV